MNKTLTFMKLALGAGVLAGGANALAQVTFYEHEGFRGRVFSASRTVEDFGRSGFNDRASSVVIDRGRWEVCTDARFEGQCTVLRPGSYDSLNGMGLNDRLSSVRPVNANGRYDNQPPPAMAAPNYQYRRRPNERLFEAPVTSVRAVVGQDNERCWVEREQVGEQRGDRNVGGAIVGGILGGIIGHQIGGGSGRDVATAGGAVAGAAIGANQNRGREPAYRDVRRCDRVGNAAPAYWDVTYNFRGTEHHAQMTAQPGQTILVNRNGEPRG